MIFLFSKGRIKNKKRYMEFAEDVINELLPRDFPKREIVIGIRFNTIVDWGLFWTLLNVSMRVNGVRYHLLR